MPYLPAGQSVHATAFKVSLYLPGGHGAPLLLADPSPQNDPGTEEHAPEQEAEVTGAAPLAASLKPQPTPARESE